MANKILNALNHAKRVGDENSKRNVKTRLAMLELARAVCRSLPHQLDRAEGITQLGPRRYFVIRGTHHWIFGHGYGFGPASRYDWYWQIDDNDTVQDLGHVKLCDAQELAYDVSSGFLQKLYGYLDFHYGDAERFRASLYLQPKVRTETATL